MIEDYVNFKDLPKTEQDEIYNQLKTIYSVALLEEAFREKQDPLDSYYLRGIRLG